VRKRGKVDGNHRDIVGELRQLGYSVLDLGAVGGGCPDICVGARAKNYLFEIKDPAQPPSKRRLTPDQCEFFMLWQGQVRKVETVEEIVEVITKSYGGETKTSN
jgi:Holliday junction resolvase